MDLSKFECQRCGTCCRWPGYVRVTDQELQDICDYLEVDICDFVEEYTYLTGDRRSLSLTEKEDGSCIFLTETGCKINDVKPVQCRNFPFTWRFDGWETKCEGGIKLAKEESELKKDNNKD